MAEEKKGFTVKDRRFFTEEEKPPEPSEAKAPEKEPLKPSEPLPKADRKAGAAGEEKDHYTFPEVNFSTFVISLNASALVHLGVLEDPGTGRKEKDLSLGKQTIDILGMLQEKTRGNLSPDEDQMLKNILYDLRILYVKQKE